jgi:hypothetical protein
MGAPGSCDSLMDSKDPCSRLYPSVFEGLFPVLSRREFASKSLKLRAVCDPLDAESQLFLAEIPCLQGNSLFAGKPSRHAFAADCLHRDPVLLSRGGAPPEFRARQILP